MLTRRNNKFILRALIFVFTVMSLSLAVNNAIAGPPSMDSRHGLPSHDGENTNQSSCHEDNARLTVAMQCNDCNNMDCRCACSPCSGVVLLCSDTLKTARYTAVYSLLSGHFMLGTHLSPHKKPPRSFPI